jgi:DNA-binding transcriptional regulator YbjK
MATTTTNDRRSVLLDEARRIVAGGGLGAMTHRSVEKAAGVPHGSVTYWFGSRDGLLDALVDAMSSDCAQEVAAIAESIQRGEMTDPAQIAAEMGVWMDEGRELHLARLELELAAARDERLREKMTDTAVLFWNLCLPLVTALGSPAPERDARAMATMVDGVLLDRLARRDADDDVLESAIRHLLGSWA